MSRIRDLMHNWNDAVRRANVQNLMDYAEALENETLTACEGQESLVHRTVNTKSIKAFASDELTKKVEQLRATWISTYRLKEVQKSMRAQLHAFDETLSAVWATTLTAKITAAGFQKLQELKYADASAMKELDELNKLALPTIELVDLSKDSWNKPPTEVPDLRQRFAGRPS